MLTDCSARMFSMPWLRTLFQGTILLLSGVIVIDVSNAQTVSMLDFKTYCSHIMFSVRASGSPRFWSYDFLINDGEKDLAIVNIGINSTYFVVVTDAGNGFLGQYHVSTSPKVVSTSGSEPFNATLEFSELYYSESGSNFFAARGAVSTSHQLFTKTVCPELDEVDCDDKYKNNNKCECNQTVELNCNTGFLYGFCQEDGKYNTSCPVPLESEDEGASLYTSGSKNSMSFITLLGGVMFSIASVLVARFGCEPGDAFPQWSTVLMMALLMNLIFVNAFFFSAAQSKRLGKDE